MPLNKLSARAAETLSAIGRHGDGGGLYLSISRNGGRRYVFLFRWRGKLTEMGLGSARPGEVSLKQAREKAAACRALIRDGVNPLDARRAKPAAVPTFGAFADQLVDDIASGFVNAKHIAQWRATLKSHCGPIRDKPIDSITTHDVLSVLKPLWATNYETASRLRGRIERVLSAAKAQGLRQGENPARWRGHLDQSLPRRQKLSRKHHAALPFDDLPTFMAELRDREAMAARALEWLILSATRGAETRGMTWGELDLGSRTWTIPPARMKAKRQHRVPITSRMLELLQALEGKRGAEDLVFPGPDRKKPFSDAAFRVLLDRMDRDSITPHGFRSTFRDWASEATSFPHEVAEMALAHVVRDATEAAYRRGDLFEKRRELMEAWATYADGRSAKIVPTASRGLVLT